MKVAETEPIEGNQLFRPPLMRMKKSAHKHMRTFGLEFRFPLRLD